MSDQNRCITAKDLYNFHINSHCQISPDGQYVLYSVQRVDRKTEKKFQNLWVAPTGKGSPWQFTYGDHSDSDPKWSSDGTRIAFISNRDNEKQQQLYIIPFGGGEARKLTDLKGEISSFDWSPDDTRLVCPFRKKDAEDIEREEDEQKKELGVISRHITRVFFKADGEGFLPKERWHIWVIDIDTGEAAQLTDSDTYDEAAPSWSTDSKEIIFISNRQKDPDLDPDAVDLFIMPAEGGDFRKIKTPLGVKESPRFSPDGKSIAYYGREGRGVTWKHTSLWTVPADGSGKAQNLTEHCDCEVSSSTINDLPGFFPTTSPTWASDSHALYVQVSHHGNTFLKAVSLDGSMVTLIGDPGIVGPFTFDGAQKNVAYLHADMKDPGEIWIRDMASGKSRKITHTNEKLLQELDLGEVEEVWFKGPQENDLQGWILKPPGFDASKKYPSILEIHGGPRVQYGNFFMHEFFYLAAQGYVIYFCNPRGSKGYGEEHSKAIWNNWGSADYADIMEWVHHVEKKEYIDTERMGVTGGSYGGYMTNWIIGHTNQFKAAVTQRSVSNWISMYGSSDMNWEFQYELGDEPPWENYENWWKQSPLKYIGNAKTPTLVIHSEQDMRTDLEQGLQVFVALKKLGVDTELVLFPDEPHGLSRGGRTDRRIERLNHIKRWFDHYLKSF